MIKTIFNKLYITSNKEVFYFYIFAIIVMIVATLIIGYKEIKKNEHK